MYGQASRDTLRMLTLSSRRHDVADGDAVHGRDYIWSPFKRWSLDQNSLPMEFCLGAESVASFSMLLKGPSKGSYL